MQQSKEQLRGLVRADLPNIIKTINRALQGQDLLFIKKILERLGSSKKIPHWFSQLEEHHSLPNLDGKTIGSIVEMLFVAVIETYSLKGFEILPLQVNPAKGIDIPNLDLGIKSPSANFCTSEPFFSAYERLLGNEYDSVIMLTDYQEAKRTPPLKLQITDFKYLQNTEIADENLCRIALKNRNWLLNKDEAWAKKIFRFLAYINQSDWRGKHLLKLVDSLQDEKQIKSLINNAEIDYLTQNRKRLIKNQEIIPLEDLKKLKRIINTKPLHLGVIDSADNWVTDIQKDFGRYPNDNEWKRLVSSPLNGKIGMSFALQWRYNFGRLFGIKL